MPGPAMKAAVVGGSPLASAAPIPNNLGPTLLLAVGVPLLPLLIGAPLVLLGLAQLRAADGTPALPWLSRLRR